MTGAFQQDYKIERFEPLASGPTTLSNQDSDATPSIILTLEKPRQGGQNKNINISIDLIEIKAMVLLK
jgi:hypothetical protein